MKDLFVFMDIPVDAAGNPVVVYNTTYAPLLNVAFHSVRAPDFSGDMAAGVWVHDHDFNWNGDNDGLNAPLDRQKAIHVRTWEPAVPWRGDAGSFIVDNTDIRLHPPHLGPLYGFPAAVLNDRTVFHEIGHKCSLRHARGNQPPFNVTAISTAIIGGILRGMVRYTVDTYTVATTIDQHVRGRCLVGPTGAMSLAEGAQVVVNGIDMTGQIDLANSVRTAVDDFNNSIDVTIVFQGPLPAGATVANTVVRGTVIAPSMMDWIMFLEAAPGAPSGPQQQRTLNWEQPVVPPERYHEEIRVRSSP